MNFDKFGLDEEETKELQALVEQQVQEHKADISRRWDALSSNSQSVGLGYDSAGNPVVLDPTLFRGFAEKFAPAQQAQQVQATQEPEPIPDPTYEKEAFAAYVQKQAEQIAKSQVQALMGQMSPILGSVQQQRINQLMETDQVKKLVDAYGDGIRDTPEFRQAFEKVMLSVQPEHWSDPKAINSAAVFAAGESAPHIEQRKHREALLSGIQAPRSGGFVPAGSGNFSAPVGQSSTAAVTYTQEEQDAARLLGRDPAWVRAYMSDQTGSDYYKAQNQPAKKGRQ